MYVEAEVKEPLHFGSLVATTVCDVVDASVSPYRVIYLLVLDKALISCSRQPRGAALQQVYFLSVFLLFRAVFAMDVVFAVIDAIINE